MDSHWAAGRILSSSCEDYCLAVRGDQIVTTILDHRDKFQYWIKDERKSLEDEGGRRLLFVLVNYATGLAIQESTMEEDLLSLIHYNKHEADSPDRKERVAVWTISDMDKKGFYCICRVDNMSLMIITGQVFRDGNAVCLGTRSSSMPHKWKMVPHRETMQVYSSSGSSTSLQQRLPTQKKTVKIYCLSREGHSLTILNDTVMIAPYNPADKYQHWIKETAYSQHVRDELNNETFALVNKATGKAIKHGFGPRYLVQLVQFNERYLDSSILWTESTKNSQGFQQIQMLTNTSAVLDAFIRPPSSTAPVGIWKFGGGANQLWKIEDFD